MKKGKGKEKKKRQEKEKDDREWCKKKIGRYRKKERKISAL